MKKIALCLFMLSSPLFSQAVGEQRTLFLVEGTAYDSWPAGVRFTCYEQWDGANADLVCYANPDDGVKFGIGTASPGRALEVWRAGDPPAVRLTNQDGAQSWEFQVDDTDNWIFRDVTDGANVVVLSGDNTGEVLRVRGDKVGIGTASPSQKLHVQDSAIAPFILLESTGTDSTPVIAQKNDTNEWRWTVRGNIGNEFSVKDQTNGTFPFQIEPLTPTNSLYLDGTGDVGIGTASPSSQLHLFNGTSPQLVVEGDATQGGTALRLDGGAATFDLAVSNALDIFSIDDDAGNSPFIIEGGAADTTLYLDSSSRVGIGTATPQAVLEVAGSVVISNGSVDIDQEVSIGGVTGTGSVVCVKSNGDLGTCSDAPNASGDCTCG